MNQIKLKGKISGIEFSHTINDIEYQKANLYVPKENAEEDIIPLKFRSNSNPGYKDGDIVVLDGNVRSYSQKTSDGKSKVNIYVFSYLDPTEDLDIYNYFQIDGRVCKVDRLRGTNSVPRFQFILANNIISNLNKQKINNYLPVVLYNELSNWGTKLKVSDQVLIKGQLHSRFYKKIDNQGNVSSKMALELVATDIEVLNETHI